MFISLLNKEKIYLGNKIMALLYKPTELSEKISKLVDKIPLSKYIIPQLSESVRKGEEPLSLMTGIDVLGPVAITRSQAIKQIGKIPQEGLSKLQKKEIEDTIKLLESVPKKSLEKISDIIIKDPEKFKDAKRLLGAWGSKTREINVIPITTSEFHSPIIEGLIKKLMKKQYLNKQEFTTDFKRV